LRDGPKSSTIEDSPMRMCNRDPGLSSHDLSKIFRSERWSKSQPNAKISQSWLQQCYAAKTTTWRCGSTCLASDIAKSRFSLISQFANFLITPNLETHFKIDDFAISCLPFHPDVRVTTWDSLASSKWLNEMVDQIALKKNWPIGDMMSRFGHINDSAFVFSGIPGSCRCPCRCLVQNSDRKTTGNRNTAMRNNNYSFKFSSEAFETEGAISRRRLVKFQSEHNPVDKRYLYVGRINRKSSTRSEHPPMTT
jgi:hypothetical protein